MPTFIDESGDTGHARDSLPYFRLAAVWLPTNAAADAFRAGVRDLRRALQLDAAFEFKYARTHSQVERRRAFFDLALMHPFRFAICAIDKTAGHWSTAPSREQHWAAATDLAVSLRSAYHQAEQPERPLREPIWVDDNGDRKFLRAVQTAFRSLRSRLHPHVPLVANPRFRGSKGDEVMQLVDMVCGAAGAAITEGDNTWFELISQRCLGKTSLP